MPDLHKKPYVVYTLSGPDNGDIFYIGITRVPLIKRLQNHISESKFNRSPKDIKIQTILKNGSRPTIEVLDFLPKWEGRWEWHSTNVEKYWISQFKAWGFPILNRKRYTLKAPAIRTFFSPTSHVTCQYLYK